MYISFLLIFFLLILNFSLDDGFPMRTKKAVPKRRPAIKKEITTTSSNIVIHKLTSSPPPNKDDILATPLPNTIAAYWYEILNAKSKFLTFVGVTMFVFILVIWAGTFTCYDLWKKKKDHWSKTEAQLQDERKLEVVSDYPEEDEDFNLAICLYKIPWYIYEMLFFVFGKVLVWIFTKCAILCLTHWYRRSMAMKAAKMRNETKTGETPVIEEQPAAKHNVDKTKKPKKGKPNIRVGEVTPV
ncbi:hypothetical protein XENTR_v10011461 [Xenopus tropicalis]|nr:hypothetical protein XENTR_v10011461 [Xenopus tropicalis]